MFSPAEKEVLKIVGRRKMTIADISNKYFGAFDEQGWRVTPMDPNNYIGRVVRRISQKCEHHDLTWTLAGERTAAGRRVWRAKR